MSELLKKYESIDQSKLNEATIKILNRVKTITTDFTAEDPKNNKIADDVMNEILKKNPDAVRIVKREPKAKPAPKKTHKATHTAKAKHSTKATPKPATASTPKGSSNNIMSVAKEIQKEGESWKDAMERAKVVLKERKEQGVEKKKSELQKLLELVRTKKELQGFANSDIDRDSRRTALPRGRRVSEKTGNVYYENRENRTDRLAPNYPQDMPLLEKGGDLTLYKIQVKYKYDLQPKWEDEKFQTGGRKFLTFAQAQDFKNKLQGLSSSMEYKVVKVGENEKLAHGGDLDEVAEIYVSGYPYYIKKMGDSTHFKLANSKEGVDRVSGSHIGQHRDEEYYEDVRSWLKGGKSPNGNKYDSKYYADGGFMNNVYANGGKVKHTFEVGQTISYPITNSTKLDKGVKNLFNKYAEKELVIDEIITDKPYNTAKVSLKSTGEKLTGEVILNPRYITFYPNMSSNNDSDVKIRDWYMKTYPTDDLGEELNDKVTFEDLWNEDYEKYNIYQVMGVGDSVIRERLFEHLAEIKGVDYGAVYRKLFTKNGMYGNGGGVGTKHFVGEFNEQQLRKGEDKIAIEKAQKETGLTYIQNKMIKKSGKPFMQVYLVSTEDYLNSNEFANGGNIDDSWDLKMIDSDEDGSYGKVVHKGKEVADYEFDRYARTFWVKNPKGGQMGIDTPEELFAFYKAKGFANGGGVDEENEYVVVLQNSETGDLLTLNVLANNEDDAKDNAYMESDLNQSYEVYSVKKISHGGSTEKYKVGQKFYDTRYDRTCEIVPSNYDGLVSWKRYNKSGTDFENDTIHSLVENQFDYLVNMGAYQLSKQSMAEGGAVPHERMFNFLKDDLGELEEAIKSGNFEEVNRFFSYWLGSSGHLKSLETKNNERMYNFLKDDLEKLMEAVENNDTEEVERFFSYWGQHLESLKMANGGSLPYMTDPNFGDFQNTGSFADGGSIGDLTEQEFLKKYFGASVFTENPSQYFEIKKLSSSDDAKVNAFVKELKADGFTVKKRAYSDFTSVMGVKKKGSFELGGAFMTDLAGHTGGGTGGLNADMPLSGVSGTNYTGLVGETGAMSSGELFMDGGAMMSNQQVINDASQPYVITESFGNPAQQLGMLAKGGAIKNQYDGRTADDVWKNWTEAQRSHFLLDHSELLDKDRMENNLGYTRTVQKDKTFSELTPLTKRVLEAHVRTGQYAKGGALKDVDDNLYVSVSKTQDDYWFITSKPTTKQQAEEMARLVTPMRGETNDVKTVGEVKAHSKTIYANGGAFAPNVSNGTQFMNGVYGNGGAINGVLNKKIKALAEKAGFTTDKLGRDEYNKVMTQALRESLTDANFHEEARELVSKVEKKEWSKDLYNSIYFNPEPNVRNFAVKVATECSWEFNDIINAYYFVTKMEGSKLANIIDDLFLKSKPKKSTTTKTDWWHTVVNPNEDFNNFDDKMPIDWEVDDFKSWIVSESDLDGNVDKAVLDVVKMPQSKLLVEYLNKNGSGKNNNEYYKKYGNWQSALYDIFTQMKRDYLASTSSSKPKKYVDHADIEKVTVKYKGKEVSFKGEDVLNGANLMEDGGDLSKIAFYIPKRDVIDVTLKDGSKIKPVNGYWVKKGSQPISAPSTTPKKPSTSGARFKFDIGDKVMINDSGYVTSFSEFDLSKPAEIIDRSTSKMGGKTYYFYKVKMADGRVAFNQAEQSKLTLANKTMPSSKSGDITADLEKFDIDSLDDYETMQYNHFFPKLGKVETLQLLINTVEGDTSQLSEKLAKLAKKQGSSFAEGGFMNNVYADGGLLSSSQIEKLDEGFTIPQLNAMLDEMFPYSFGFEVWKQEQSSSRSSKFSYDYENQVKDDKLKLYFYYEGYGRDLNYEVRQGQENTYFNFLLVDDKINTYVGGFGFKDKGDVDESYITKFVSFLHDAYHYSFQVRHSVMADGGMFEDNDGFMKADNNFNYRYPQGDVYVETMDEPIDLTNSMSSRTNEVVIQPLNEDINLNEDGRIRAKMTQTGKGSAEKLMAVNPRMTLINLPKPMSSTHRNND